MTRDTEHEEWVARSEAEERASLRPALSGEPRPGLRERIEFVCAVHVGSMRAPDMADEILAALSGSPQEPDLMSRCRAARNITASEVLGEVYEFWKGRPDRAPGISLREKVRAALSGSPQETPPPSYEAPDENLTLLHRLDEWKRGDSDTAPLIRWAAAHLRGCVRRVEETPPGPLDATPNETLTSIFNAIDFKNPERSLDLIRAALGSPVSPNLSEARLAIAICSTFDMTHHDHEAFLQPDHCEQGEADARELADAYREVARLTATPPGEETP